MATDFELAVFERQLQEALELPEAKRWILERDDSVPLGILATMHPRSNTGELYKARLRWSDLYKPPSLKFIDISTNCDTGPNAWPRCHGFRPGALDACLPWTEEGQRLHPEWQNSSANAFPKTDAPIQFALINVQSSLDQTYQGRGP
jgi:hypothetical protein